MGLIITRSLSIVKVLMTVYTLLYLVGVPETDSTTKWQLPHQQIVHPPESKLQVLHLILLEMIVNVLWRQTDRYTDRQTDSCFYMYELTVNKPNPKE